VPCEDRMDKCFVCGKGPAEGPRTPVAVQAVYKTYKGQELVATTTTWFHPSCLARMEQAVLEEPIMAQKR